MAAILSRPNALTWIARTPYTRQIFFLQLRVRINNTGSVSVTRTLCYGYCQNGSEMQGLGGFLDVILDEQKHCHVDEIFVSGCTRNCENHNF